MKWMKSLILVTKFLVNVNNGEEGSIVDIVKMTDELMSELDDIRMREFVKDVQNMTKYTD